MNKLFCNICKEERDVTKSGKEGVATFQLLSCGHRLLSATFSERMSMSELFGFRGKGKTDVKYNKNDDQLNMKYSKKFIEYGDVDYEAAIVLFNIQDRSYDFMNQAAFLSAQSTEKYLKAFLFWNSKIHYHGLQGREILDKFKRLSHNLENILDECIQDNSGFSKFEEQVKKINKYSLLKYPDIEDEMIYSDSGLMISSDILKDIKKIGDFVKSVVQLNSDENR
jgi:HEPN domain-containing protein